MTPDDRKYAKTHEWVKIEGNTATVGISDYAQQSMGDLTFIECPEVGQALKQGQESGSVESVKAVSEIFAPVSGEVTETNAELEEHPERVNDDPYGDGWIYKLGNVDAAELDNLLDASQYDAECE